jgi:hypothetical protein
VTTRAKKTGKPRAKPHARKKAAAQDRAAMTLDEQWAEGIHETLLASCHPKQRDAYEDDARRISILVGRGGGKTSVLIARALRKMTRKRNAFVAFVATSRPWAKRLIWLALKNTIEKLGMRDEFDFSEVELTCTCKRTGGRYMLFGADDTKEIDKLRGTPFDEVQIDEAASFDLELLEYLIDEAVGPRLGERDGCIVLSGTPGHILRGIFHDVSRPGTTNDDGSPKHRPYAERREPAFAGWLGWSSHHWNMLYVLALPNARTDYIALVKNWEDALRTKKERGWTDANPKWRREYLGIWTANNTTTMYAYSARREGEDSELLNRWMPYGDKKLEGLPMLEAAVEALTELRPELAPERWLFGYGLDLGARDPFALNILALHPDDLQRCYYHVFSFERRRMYARAIAELLVGQEYVERILRREKLPEPGGLFGVTGWPVAIVADLAGLGEAIILELQNVYGITIKAAEKKDKLGAIEVVNGDFIDERMFILGDTPLEQQLEGLQWKPDEYGVPREDKAAPNHSADSWTYIRTEVGTMFGTAPPPRDGAASPAAAARAGRAGTAPMRREQHTKTRGKVGKANTAGESADRWGSEPVRSVARDPAGTPTGEYDVLISSFDTGWGND